MATRVKNVGNWRIMPDATLAASYQAYKMCRNPEGRKRGSPPSGQKAPANGHQHPPVVSPTPTTPPPPGVYSHPTQNKAPPPT
ncbi:hypothetical protein KCA24_30760, partial [Escherichia coli]|nr:hypothetical protein [Escherichia coli]